eukprot:scaffold9270_cov88-Skeletonema_marinoi.AAC.1
MTLRPAPVEAALTEVEVNGTAANADANGSAPSGEDGNIATAAAAAAAPTLQKGDTPILLSQAFFLFGSDSHGHNSRLFVQQTFLMREELDEMMGDNRPSGPREDAAKRSPGNR